MRIPISFVKKIIVYVIAIVIGYTSLIYFLGNGNYLNISDDILMRKNFLLHALNKESLSPIFSKISDSQQKGEYALVTYAMATYALTNIAIAKPEIKEEVSNAIKKWIDIVLTRDVYSFDEVAWDENPLDEATFRKDRGHIGYYGHLNLMLGAYALINSDGKF